MAIGVVTSIIADKRTSKAGKPFTMYVIEVDGRPYEFGFKKPEGVNRGDNIQFDAEKKFGRDAIVEGSLSKAPSGAASVAPKTGGGYSRGGGVFPIPANDGQRSIIRQNAVTNAREVVASYGGAIEGESLEEYMSRIIGIAQLIEQYTTGDLDTIAEEFTTSD